MTQRDRKEEDRVYMLYAWTSQQQRHVREGFTKPHGVSVLLRQILDVREMKQCRLAGAF